MVEFIVIAVNVKSKVDLMIYSRILINQASKLAMISVDERNGVWQIKIIWMIQKMFYQLFSIESFIMSNALT